VREGQVVITMLTDGGAVESVASQAVPAMAEGAVWAQMSTVGVEALERLATLAGDAGVPLVDAPVIGTKLPAERGELTVLASGEADALHKCGPVFEAVASKTVELGDQPGAATRMKVVINCWLVALIEGLAESIALAEGIGVDPAKFIEVIDGGPTGPPYAKMKGTMMIERSYEPSFTLALAAKDAGLALAAAEDAGLDLPALRAIREQLDRAASDGHADEDMAAAVEASRPG
jgi:3-hydroxyisobutyrate dehydrogenase